MMSDFQHVRPEVSIAHRIEIRLATYKEVMAARKDFKAFKAL